MKSEYCSQTIITALRKKIFTPPPLFVNEFCCNSWSTAKQPIHRRTDDRILIGFITNNRIIVIEKAATLLLYLNLCAYRVRCLSATWHSYLIDLQRYDSRRYRLVPRKNTSSTNLTHLGHSNPAWAITTQLGPLWPCHIHINSVPVNE